MGHGIPPRGLLAVLLLGIWLAPAAAHDQEAAPAIRDDVEAVWHAPPDMRAGEQFQGFIRFTEDSTIQGVGYQVCIMDRLVCIISPRPAELQEDGRTWVFDTADYTDPGSGRHHNWPAGRLGVQYFLSKGNLTAGMAEEDLEGLERFPEGPPLNAKECQGRVVACYEESYFTFDVAPGEGRSAPALALPALVVVLLAMRRRVTGGP